MSAIIPFLKNKVVFITGATGFLGKGVVEKLMRHVPEIGRIYLLIRPQHRESGKKISADDRLVSKIWMSDAFARLREQLGDRFEGVMREKLVAVAGDLTQERLGIDAELYDRLTREVDIIINSAATVVFDEPIDLALEQNTLGPQRVMAFARACRNAIFVHVSTAYVNGRQKGKIYEFPPIPGQTVAQLIDGDKALSFDLEGEIAAIQAFARDIEMASHAPDLMADFHKLLNRQDRGKRITEHRRTHQVEALRQRWKRDRMVKQGMQRGRELGWHDSYTLTKAMGEQLIVKNRGNLPTVIVRPSIIESSLSDPEPGWLDGLKVADPLIAHYGKGRLPDFPARPDVVLDVIPVDIIVSAIVGLLPTIAQEPNVKIYHVATGSENPMRVGDMVRLVYEYFLKNPMRDRHGNPIVVKPWKFPSLAQFQRHLKYRYQLPLKSLIWMVDHVPFGDFSKQKRRLSLIDATLENAMSLSDIYTSYVQLDCEFQIDHMQQLHQAMNEEDRKIFNCDVSRINWPEYIQHIHIPGLKRHVLKAGDELGK